MGSQSLYRKYRSRSLDEIVGQEHITTLLSRAIASDNISHAYLMTGPHGVGKTSIARILAHEINRLPYKDDATHLDIIEIDAASNNGVEDVRELRERVHVAPSSASYKVYIIDEVHMLSKQAFNALLKTLEEPPAHVVFILATTDADKLPATIISRVQRFNFRTISDKKVANHLRKIADNEAIKISDEALDRIVTHGQGSFRDSITLLDQLQNIRDDEITVIDVDMAIGAPSTEIIDELLSANRSADITTIDKLLLQLEASGISAATTASSLITRLRGELPKNPTILQTIDALLEVSRSPFPYIKLLTSLASSTAHGKQSSVDAPMLTNEIKPSKPAKTPTPSSTNTPTTVKPSTKKPTPSPPTQTASSVIFDWDALMSRVEDTSIRSLLTNAGHAVAEDTLTIYVGNKFNASKLSGERLAKLHSALEKAGGASLTVVVSPKKQPPSDSRLSEIAAIMGGGEEVELGGN